MKIASLLAQAGIQNYTIKAVQSSNNSNYHIQTNTKDYLLKLYSCHISAVNIQKQDLFYAQQASNFGVAPKVVFSDLSSKCIIFEYINPLADNLDAASFIKAYNVFSQSVVPKTTKLTLEETAAYYLSSDLKIPQIAALKQKLHAAINYLASNDLAVGLCHMDLSLDNILFTKDKCYLIDFEYSCWNYKIFDYLALLDSGCYALSATLKQNYSQVDIYYASLYYFIINFLWYRKSFLTSNKNHFAISSIKYLNKINSLD